MVENFIEMVAKNAPPSLEARPSTGLTARVLGPVGAPELPAIARGMVLPGGAAGADSTGVALEPLARPTFLLDAFSDAPELASLGCGSVAFFSRRSPDREGANEDALAILPVGADSAILVVADGLGGQSAGEVASRTALESLAESVAGVGPEGSLRTAILDGLEMANQRILAFGTGAGTTISLVEVSNDGARPYHVGDSMILLTGNRGLIKLQTIAHSPVGYGVEAGLIDEEESLSHEDRHLVSNIVGSPEMRIEIGPPIKLSPLDTLVVASDGLADNLQPAEIVDLVRKGPLARAASGLAAEVLRRMVSPTEGLHSKPDDLSFILFRPKRPI